MQLSKNSETSNEQAWHSGTHTHILQACDEETHNKAEHQSVEETLCNEELAKHTCEEVDIADDSYGKVPEMMLAAGEP